MSLSPHLFVVLGATGDLFSRKLLPAIFSLAVDPDAEIIVLGAATRDLDDAGFRAACRSDLAAAGVSGIDSDKWCDDRLHYERTDRKRGEWFHTDWTGRGGDVFAGSYNA